MEYNKFVTVEDIAKYLNVDKVQILSWVSSGHIPHSFIGDAGPFFVETRVKAWFNRNCKHSRGRDFPGRIIVISDETGDVYNPPNALKLTDGIRKIGISEGITSGVYFLCKGDDVVYVGKAKQVAVRICTHLAEKNKDFDFEGIWFLPVSIERMGMVEREFIRIIKPKYNIAHKPEEDEDEAT